MPSFLYPQRGGRALRARGKQRRRRCTNATPIFFPEKENGRRPSKRKAFRLAVSGLNDLCASGMRLPARGVAALASAIRLGLLLLSDVAQRVQLFKPQTGNVGGRGALPSRSLGGSRGPFSHVREWPPYCALPHAAGEPKTQPLRAAPPSAPAGCPKPRSRAYVASAEPRSALKSGRNALHSHPSSQRRRTPSPSFTSKVKTTASSVCALTR